MLKLFTRQNLRTSIFSTFTLLLFAAFLLVGGVFSLVVTRYIHAVIQAPDTENLRYVATSLNFTMLLLLGAAMLISIAVTAYLSGLLSLPLRVLSAFARRIGEGDYTPNPPLRGSVEFETLNQSLNHTAKQLAKYDSDQKVFFQNVSHQLRSPLMVIQSHGEGIKYGVMDTQKAIDTILEASGQLKSMVDDILYVSRIDSIELPEMQQADLSQLITDRIHAHRALWQQAGLTVTLVPAANPVMLRCVVSYISRALDNLIANAVRHAATNITLHCYEKNGHAFILVQDNGPGFQADMLPRAFERFSMGEKGVSGIGLSIVKSVVAQHKGCVTAENNTKGALVTLKFPCK